MSIADDLAPSGVLRASINLGNPVLAQGDAADPRGVTVDLARDVAERLRLPLRLLCFDAARDSFAAVRDGAADLCFLAVEPAREADVAFTAPYAVLEGMFAVRADSDLRAAEDVDRSGVAVGVKAGSAYDLFLTRTLQHARIERGAEGTSTAEEQHLEVAAGIRAPLAAWVADRPEWRLIEPAFMRIQQAVGVPRDRSDAAVRWLRELIEARKADGFVADALRRSGRTDAQVAPPA